MNGIYIFIISGFIYADALVVDDKTGLKNIVMTKTTYKTYLVKSLIFNFIIAGIFAILPSLINLILWFAVRPNVPLVHFNIMNMAQSDLFVDIFLKSKVLFFFLHFLKIFFLSGIIASFAIFINTKFNNRYLGLMVTYIIDTIIAVSAGFLPTNFQYSFFAVFYSIIKPDFMTLLVGLVFLLPSLIYFIKLAKRGGKYD
ncbi:MAG: hypothetical protein Q4D88_00745 [Anaerococcus sp.]|nr:hypothetical protein [Anaerococcus sp.]